MKRQAEEFLDNWLRNKRRKPLMIRGARQVGKSTLVRKFAATRGMQLNEINLERHLDLDDVFATLDLGVIRRELEALLGGSLDTPESILFLDEIQATPRAIAALRYFQEDWPDLPVISAGSLLEFTLSDHAFSMPVGRIEVLHLGPMRFREFLWAVEPEMDGYLDELDFDRPVPKMAHRKLLDRQRQFLFVGGMPEAVLEYKESASLEQATAVHRRIASTYEDDFSKYARRGQLALMQRIFRAIPRHVGEKVKYVNFSRQERSRLVKGTIELLANARVCHRVFSSDCSGIPLDASIHEFVYKLLFLDVGLMNHICGTRLKALSTRDPIRMVNEGAVAEQFVGQHLVDFSRGIEKPSLVYWLREGRGSNAEVDFVIAVDGRVFPIEVKAGKSGSLRSLHQFVARGKSKIAMRFDLNPLSRQRVECQVPVGHNVVNETFDLFSLPLYAVEEIDRLVR